MTISSFGRTGRMTMLVASLAFIGALGACKTTEKATGGGGVTEAAVQAPQVVKAESTEDFVGSYDGYWQSAGKRGDADWSVQRGSSVHVTIDASIDTPGGPVNYRLAPDFDATDGVLTVDSPSIEGTIVKMSDGSLIFDYKRNGRNGKYVMQPAS